MPQLTHIDPVTGKPSMVDVSDKAITRRTATASGRIFLPPAAFELVSGAPVVAPVTDAPAIAADTTALDQAKAKARAKGDVLAVAQLAGIMAAKRTADLIPLCHPLALSHVAVVLTPVGAAAPHVRVEATVACTGRTGVEMEALTAASAALLTVWDMLKAVAGRDMRIGDIVVARKSGGRSGDFVREDTDRDSGVSEA
jgi:molybdenum cofactor biosynthesis protein MoaC